jgi:hypothetical protein
VISEARKRENDRIVSRSVNHTKELWQIMKKESGNYQKTNQNISSKIVSMIVIVTNPQYIPHEPNAFFFLVEIVDKMLNENKGYNFGHDTVNNKILRSNSVFLAAVTEEEVLNVTSKLKDKFSAGWLEIPERLLKESIQYI